MFRRHLLGMIALALFAGAAWLWWSGISSNLQQIVFSSCLRIGLMTAVVWLAWPELEKLPRFLCIAGVALLAVMLRWPKLALFFLPILAVIWLLRPRKQPASDRPKARQTEQPPERR